MRVRARVRRTHYETARTTVLWRRTAFENKPEDVFITSRSRSEKQGRRGGAFAPLCFVLMGCVGASLPPW